MESGQVYQIELLTALVCTFAAIIAVLLLCVIALAAKVIFDCVQTTSHNHQEVQTFPLKINHNDYVSP